MERMKKMMENLSEEERVKMMERCFEIMKGKEIGKDREPKERKREESPCFPGMDRMADCCPEMMGSFFSKMMGGLERTRNEEKKDPIEKTEKSRCC